VKLNCDLGEGHNGVDAQIMPHIHMANIACGGHAGDEHSMKRCVSLAINYGVQVGAHPSYPDRENMGRKSLTLPRTELQDSVLEQVNSLAEICDELGSKLTYIKPHGALYNDMMRDENTFLSLLEVCSAHYPSLPLLIQSTLDNDTNFERAQQYSHYVMFEGFADRRYTDKGLLVPRSQTNAVYQFTDEIVAQALNLCNKGGLVSENGQWLELSIDTLCVHGDTPAAVDALLAISQHLYAKA